MHDFAFVREFHVFAPCDLFLLRRVGRPQRPRPVVGLVQNSQSAPLRTIVSVAGNSITLILQENDMSLRHKPSMKR